MEKLNELVEALYPQYGAPGSRDVEITARRKAIDESAAVIAEAFRALEQRAEAGEAIVADVEEVINLLAEREWAEHCTKTDTGKRLEEAITELHDEAAPAVNLDELVPEKWTLKQAEKFVEDYTPPSEEESVLFAVNSFRAAILRNIEEAK